MPNGDWESVTVPEELLERLEGHREGEEAIWRAIERVLDAHEEGHDPAGYDGSQGVEVVRMDQGVIDDVASATSSAVLRELDPAGLR